MPKKKSDGGGGYLKKKGHAAVLTYGPPEEAELMKRAAKIDGRSLRSFVWVAAMKAANAVIRKN